jgi:hypothetical protein
MIEYVDDHDRALEGTENLRAMATPFQAARMPYERASLSAISFRY